MNSSYSNHILKYLSYFLRLAFVLAIFILCLTASYYVVKYAYPFVIAFLLAILINPAVNWCESSLKLPRSLSVLTVMFGIFGTMIGVLSLFTIEIVNGLSSLVDKIPQQAGTLMNFLNKVLVDRLVEFWEKITHVFYNLDPSQQSTIRDNIQGLNKEITTFITNLGTDIISGLTQFILSLPSALTIIIIIVLSTFFISKDWHHISYYLRLKLANNIHTTLLHVFQDLKSALAGYFRAQIALMSITGAVMMVCLSILHVNHAFTIAILTALVDFLPYIGTGAVLIPWSLYSYLNGAPMMALYLGLLYLLLVIIRQILEPKMLAVSIGLNPLATLIAVFVGFKLFGVLGLFIGPGVLVLVKSLSHTNVFKTTWRFITNAPEK